MLPIDYLFQMYLVRFGYLAPPDPYTGSLVSYEDYKKSISDFQKMVDLPVTGEILFCHIYKHINVYETVRNNAFGSCCQLAHNKQSLLNYCKLPNDNFQLSNLDILHCCRSD